jgi:hypothetical protein
MRAAARMRSANPPIAIPTIAPVGSEEDFVTGGVAEVVVAGGAVGAAVAPVYVVVRVKLGCRVSGRKDSPGLNSSVEFRANAIWAANVWVAFWIA